MCFAEELLVNPVYSASLVKLRKAIKGGDS